MLDRWFNAQRPAPAGEYLALVMAVLVATAAFMAFSWWSVEHGVPSLLAGGHKEAEATTTEEVAAEAESATADASTDVSTEEGAATAENEPSEVTETATAETETTEEAATDAVDAVSETAAASVAEPAVAEEAHDDHGSNLPLVIFLCLIGAIFASGFWILLATRRLKDAGWAPLWAMLVVVPGINLLALMAFAAIPGGKALESEA